MRLGIVLLLAAAAAAAAAIRSSVGQRGDNEAMQRRAHADGGDVWIASRAADDPTAHAAMLAYSDAATSVPRDDDGNVFFQSKSRSCWAAVAYNLNMWREKTLGWASGVSGGKGYFRYYLPGNQDCEAMAKLDECDSSGPNLKDYCYNNPESGATKEVLDKVVRALKMKIADYSVTRNWSAAQWKKQVSTYGPHIVSVWTSLPAPGPHVAILESVFVNSNEKAAQFFIADVNSGAAGVQADGSRILSFEDFKSEQQRCNERTSQLSPPLNLGAAWFPNPLPKLACDNQPNVCDCDSSEHGFYLKGAQNGEPCADWEQVNGSTPSGFNWCYIDHKCIVGKLGSFEGRKWRKCLPGYKGSFLAEKANGLTKFV